MSDFPTQKPVTNRHKNQKYFGFFCENLKKLLYNNFTFSDVAESPKPEGIG
jgi:hypothetical protein